MFTLLFHWREIFAALPAALADVPFDALSNVTATAVLGWYAWHTASKTIPGLVRAFREETAALRQECRAERDAQRQDLAAERSQRHADHQEFVAALDRFADRCCE